MAREAAPSQAGKRPSPEGPEKRFGLRERQRPQMWIM